MARRRTDRDEGAGEITKRAYAQKVRLSNLSDDRADDGFRAIKTAPLREGIPNSRFQDRKVQHHGDGARRIPRQ